MSVILKIDDLSKVYKTKGYVFGEITKNESIKNRYSSRNVEAVKNISLEIEEGEIFGLLGTNGAGKSTILKMICGLIKPTSGKVLLEGEIVGFDSCTAKEKIGALIENPAFFNHLSARKNLQYLADMQGGVSDKRIDDLLDMLGLTGRADDKIMTYSMGMKQKVGIAQAIMHKPKLLILDEPTNGLDPQWIILMREFLIKLAKEYKMTIIISSHILSEMQQLCDRVAILNKGSLMAVKKISDLDKEDNSEITIEIKVDNIEEAGKVLLNLGYEYKVVNGIIKVRTDDKDVGIISKELVLNGISLYGMEIKKKLLEEVFEEYSDNSEASDSAVAEKDIAENIFGDYNKTDNNGDEKNE